MAANSICSVEGCEKPVHAHGLCSSHAHRLRRHGDPLGGGTPLGDVRAFLEVLKSHADASECVEWPFARNRYGRAVIRLDGKVKQVSRVLLEARDGPPNGKMDAAHNCGKGHLACVNIHHLRWATKAENEADKVLHGTRNRGERVPSAKLTEEIVRQIRASTLPDREVAALFGIKKKHVWPIRARKIWKHVA